MTPSYSSRLARAPRRAVSLRPPTLRWLSLPLLVLAFVLAGPAIAWSALGHKLVGALAERHLTAAARAEVKRLLAGEPDPTLAGVATWADRLRDTDPAEFKRTSRWHYVNFREGQCSYVPARDCKDGQCVVGAIETQRAILADRSKPLAERRDALKFLVHLVGDVHQPMHTGNRPDKGGNDYQISLRTTIEPEAYARDRYVGGVMGTNLHSVWDYYVLAEQGLDLQAYTDRLAAQPWPPKAGAARDAGAWASESCGLVDALYPRSKTGAEQHRLDRGYALAHKDLAELRIRVAAFRLAAMLNRTLGAPQR